MIRFRKANRSWLLFESVKLDWDYLASPLFFGVEFEVQGVDFDLNQFWALRKQEEGAQIVSKGSFNDFWTQPFFRIEFEGFILLKPVYCNKILEFSSLTWLWDFSYWKTT